MINLLTNIEHEFLEIDKALKAFNNDIKSNLTESFIIQRLSQLNPEISERLKEVKLNMAAFDMAIKIQNLDTSDAENRKQIKAARTVLDDTLTRLTQSKNQLQRLCQSPSAINSALQILLENIKEWEFLLSKHLLQYELIMD